MSEQVPPPPRVPARDREDAFIVGVLEPMIRRMEQQITASLLTRVPAPAVGTATEAEDLAASVRRKLAARGSQPREQDQPLRGIALGGLER